MTKPKNRTTNIYGEQKDHAQSSIEVKRFKNADGREGSYAPLGNGLIKVLFDDGEMVMVRETGTGTSGGPSDDIPF